MKKAIPLATYGYKNGAFTHTTSSKDAFFKSSQGYHGFRFVKNDFLSGCNVVVVRKTLMIPNKMDRKWFKNCSSICLEGLFFQLNKHTSGFFRQNKCRKYNFERFAAIFKIKIDNSNFELKYCADIGKLIEQLNSDSISLAYSVFLFLHNILEILTCAWIIQTWALLR